MEDRTFLTNNPTDGISDTFRTFIEELVKAVVLEGVSFDNQKKWLRKHSEAEGVNCETIESSLTDLFGAIKELEEHESQSTERLVGFLAKGCYLSEDLANTLLDNAAATRTQKEKNDKKEDEAYRKCTTIATCDKYLKDYPQGRYVREVRNKKAQLEQEAEWNRQKLVEKNRIPVKIILISLGVISIVDIIFLRWWCVIPLIFNAYMALVAHEKCGQGAFGYEKLVFKGGALVVILFFASFLHWWSLLLIFPAIYFIIGKDEDIWDLD